MIRVPLRDLQTAFSKPAQYVKSLESGGRGGGPSKYGMLLHAVGRFHSSNDIEEAEEYLEDKIVKNFKNVADLPQYIEWLHAYVQEFDKLGNAFVRVRDKVTIPIAARFKNLIVSGEAARIDIVPAGGYSIWVFRRNAPDWKDDPRMPLLQFAYSQKLARDPSEVLVGVYDFVAQKHFSTHYSEATVDKARDNLRNLLKLIQSRK